MKTKKRNGSREGQFRYALDTCSKNGDLSGALELYETAVAEGLRLSAYHFNSLLHILSSSVENLDDESSKQSTVDTGSRVFNAMIAAGIVPNEATITSMARIASCQPDGSGADLAFDLIRNMREKYAATPRLRTYGPALFAFCRQLEAEKAYALANHMVSSAIMPEEPEIAALLDVSAKVGREGKVYEYLHMLRNNVRCVSSSTAGILEDWFNSKSAAEAGSSSWSTERVKDAIVINGRGWHGLGWLGGGRWDVNRTSVGADGHCAMCFQLLDCVDIAQKETKEFADSVANLAMERETMSNFKRFQEWLEDNKGCDAIIDGANVALYQQNFADGGFSLSQLNDVASEIFRRNKKKWPLIILHNKRIQALMGDPYNRQLLDAWRSEGALYMTPSGSNDDCTVPVSPSSLLHSTSEHQASEASMVVARPTCGLDGGGIVACAWPWWRSQGSCEAFATARRWLRGLLGCRNDSMWSMSGLRVIATPGRGLAARGPRGGREACPWPP
ncbi:hypothetical protein ZIOFF_024492 [Zingiber officinale]|uniref:ribonuclease P n=1 Tax=Zingiber officinale TaxID=94328 RepID=A0A8J5H0E8_ZINOF|nr:hypothetical protein ZIOFF_024492 [Zingiber officinale]